MNFVIIGKSLTEKLIERKCINKPQGKIVNQIKQNVRSQIVKSNERNKKKKAGNRKIHTYTEEKKSQNEKSNSTNSNRHYY